jgi:hypothetical protein
MTAKTWFARRRESRRTEREQTGDTPEKAREDGRRQQGEQGSVEDAAARASTGLVANGSSFQG